MSRRIPFIFLLILLAAPLAACGSKGPLVKPGQQETSKNKHAAKLAPEATTPATPAQPVPAASGDDSGKL